MFLVSVYLCIIEFLISFFFSVSISMGRGLVEENYSFISFTIFTIIGFIVGSGENIEILKLFTALSCITNAALYNWVFQDTGRDRSLLWIRYFAIAEILFYSRYFSYGLILITGHLLQ